MFDVFVRNITFKLHNESIPINSIQFDHLSDDNMTMNFTVSLYEPYLLGLLLKRSDRFWVQLKYNLLDTVGYFKPEFSHL
jgi:hypothetical protein